MAGKQDTKTEERFTPIHGQFPDGDNIACEDCKYRDRTVVTIGSVTKAVGITKASCEIYANKPTGILFQNLPCEYYQKDG